MVQKPYLNHSSPWDKPNPWWGDNPQLPPIDDWWIERALLVGFYRGHFILSKPPDVEMSFISRTTEIDQVAMDLLGIAFTVAKSIGCQSSTSPLNMDWSVEKCSEISRKWSQATDPLHFRCEDSRRLLVSKAEINSIKKLSWTNLCGCRAMHQYPNRLPHGRQPA